MAETRQSYPSGETGDRQWSHELSLLPADERMRVLEQSLHQEAQSHANRVQSMIAAAGEANRRASARLKLQAPAAAATPAQ